MKISLTLLLFTISQFVLAQETIEFPSQDGLVVTADLYPKKESKKFILLFHQAGWSRGEYQETAPMLNTLGYNCIAVDQRSGGKVNGVTNETNARAKKAGKATTFKDAFQDIAATVAYVKKTYNPEEIIIWGSSYSSSLVLKYAGDFPNEIDAVLSFSPGEYFGDKKFISKSAVNIKVPVFITSAKNEKGSWWTIYQAMEKSDKSYFLPTQSGQHGSRALWAKFDESSDYWTAVKEFLAKQS